MITHAPDQAAARLEALDAQAVAAFVTELDTAEAANVLTPMMPGSAAAIITYMQDAKAGAILSAMPAPHAGAIARHLDAARYETLIAHMSADHGRLVQMLASYPANTAAAWMRTGIAVLADDLTAGQGREKLATLPDNDIIYVTTRTHRLRGHITPGQLLRPEAGTPVADMIRTEPYHIAATARLSALINHAGWQTRHALPVLDSHQQLVGALYHNDLYRGLKARNRDKQSTPASPIQDIGRLYAGTLLTLFKTAGGLVQGSDTQH